MQRCIIHQVRHSLRYVAWRDHKAFISDLKTIYRAKDADAGRQALGGDHRRGEARRRGRHRHGRLTGHRRDGQSHGHGRRRARHGRHGARRRHPGHVGHPPHGPDGLRPVEIAADGGRPLCDGRQERAGRVRWRHRPPGVVVVPQERAADVLKEAQSIDARESGMYPFIRQFKSLQEAIKKFNRI